MDMDGDHGGSWGGPPVPDGIDLILDADAMVSVFEAQRLARIDRYRLDALTEALALGRAAPEVVERSVRLELAAAMRVTEHTAGLWMERAEALVHRYPDAFEALARADITPRHAEILTKALDAAEPAVRDRIDAVALQLARTLPVGVFRRRLRELIERECAADLPARHAAALTNRRACIENDRDGMAWLHLYAPAVEVHAAFERATRIGKTVIDADRENVRFRRARTAGVDASGADAVGADAVGANAAGADAAGPDRTGEAAEAGIRTLDQARADVLCDLLIDGSMDRHPEEARGIRATVVVTVPALSLLDDDAVAGAPATVEGVRPIPIERARELCGGGKDWMRVLTHPETGMVVSVGRDRYRPPAALRRLVKWRADRCMAPGCGIPAERCEIDHQLDWALGGQTALQNLSPFRLSREWSALAA